MAPHMMNLVLIPTINNHNSLVDSTFFGGWNRYGIGSVEIALRLDLAHTCSRIDSENERTPSPTGVDIGWTDINVAIRLL